MMPNRPLIAAIGCGGTISSLGRDSTDVLDYPDFGTKLPIARRRHRHDGGNRETIPALWPPVG
jgi:hypothetical protein